MAEKKMIRLTSDQKAELLKKYVTFEGSGREFVFYSVKHGEEVFDVTYNMNTCLFNCTCKHGSYYGVKKNQLCCHIKAIILKKVEYQKKLLYTIKEDETNERNPKSKKCKNHVNTKKQH